jgi:Nucleoside 2-deoxyribosyltransferase like
MIVYKAPQYYRKNKFTIFLGGSIEMGNCEDWQSKITQDLSDKDVILLNPRRDDFDSTQEQSINNPYFRNQVEWELDGLMRADLIIMYLLPNTLSPISLLEIGLMTDSFTCDRQNNDKIIICCPDGFWRKGNIEVVARRFGITLVNDYFSLITKVLEKINTR